jgi:hypothetical protein
MAGYSRNDTANNIADGNIINASDLDGEFDAIQSAFDSATGHSHDGTTGEGVPIEVVGPAQDVVITATEVKPKTDNTLDLGTPVLEYKDLYIDGTAHIDTLDIDENASITGTTSLGDDVTFTGATNNVVWDKSDNALEFTDNAKAVFGTGDDLTISHNATDNIINSTNGDVKFQFSGTSSAELDSTGIKTDQIDELTSATGVTVDGLLLKDISVGTADQSGTNTAGTNVTIKGGASTGSANGGSIVFQTTQPGVSGTGVNTQVTAMTIDGTGDVTLTGDLNFGDNDKAIFGAGSDLEIYHDGSHSYVWDKGTGSLRLRGANLSLENPSGSLYLSGTDGGEVSLWYGNTSKKLATTSTGIDVTGTVTADGLTVNSGGDQTVYFGDDNDGVMLGNTGAVSYVTLGGWNASAAVGEFKYNRSNGRLTYGNTSSVTSRFSVDNNGDIYFYEDTGTTPKFFWDASAESLGIGTTSPSYTLDAVGGCQFNANTGSDYLFRFYNASSTGYGALVTAGNGTSPIMKLRDYAGNDRVYFSGNGNVGIGVSSPSGILHLASPGNSGDMVFRTDEVTSGYQLTQGMDNVGGYSKTNSTGRGFRWIRDTTEDMRIDSSGNLYLGATSGARGSVATKQFIKFASGQAYLELQANSTTQTDSGLLFSDGSTGNYGLVNYDHSADAMRFFVASAERMRIDSSGNLLVGTTDSVPGNNSGTGNTGIALQGGDAQVEIASNGAGLIANRVGTDGDIALFRKDGTTVGSIGNTGANPYFVNSTTGGFRFGTSSGSTIIIPCNETGTSEDDKHDIGSSTNRWRNLYLSGGVYLGGTGSANYLDDYEEGTWTPTFGAGGTAPSVTYAYSYGYYVKIGSFVHVGIAISTTAFSGGSGTLTIDLPFTTTSSTNYRSSGYFAYNNMIVNPSSGGAPIVYVGQTNGYLLFYNCTTEGKSSTPLTPSNVSVSGTGYLQMFATFRTDS